MSGTGAIAAAAGATGAFSGTGGAVGTAHTCQSFFLLLGDKPDRSKDDQNDDGNNNIIYRSHRRFSFNLRYIRF